MQQAHIKVRLLVMALAAGSRRHLMRLTGLWHRRRSACSQVHMSSSSLLFTGSARSSHREGMVDREG